MKKCTSQENWRADNADETESEGFEEWSGEPGYVSWGSEHYSHKNQLGAIKKCYRYLTGGGKKMQAFLKQLNAIPNIKYHVSEKKEPVLYRENEVFELFKTFETTAKVIEKRHIRDLDDLVFQMENSEH